MRPFFRKAWSFSKNLTTGRSPDIETILKKKHGVFLKISKRAGHPTLRPLFLEKRGVF